MITTVAVAPTHGEAYRLIRAAGVPYREAIAVVTSNDLYRLRGKTDLTLLMSGDSPPSNLTTVDYQFLLLHVKTVEHE